MAVSDTAWSFSPADYTPEQWQRACLIDTEEGAPNRRDRYWLPYREPSGDLNRHGIHAVAAKLHGIEGVSVDKKAAAARRLVLLYRSDLGEAPPDAIVSMSGDGVRSAPDTERLYATTFFKGGSDVEVRRGPDGNPSRVIGGVAAAFGKRSVDLGGFYEMIDPQAFNKSRSDGWPGAIARYNHLDTHLLGTTRSGTLKLWIDKIGLNYEVDCPQCRGDCLEMVIRKDVSNSSFAFQAYEEDWTMGDGIPVRTLMSTRLIDVAPVTIPAYPDATVGLRSLARFVGAPLEDVVKKAASNELRSFFVRTDDSNGKPKKPAPMFGPAALMDILSKRPDDPIGRTA
jgi:hypothetical protein